MRSKFISFYSLLFVVGITLMMFSCGNEHSVEFDRYYSSGSLIYQTQCQNCHGANGEGLQGLIPPLTDSIYLKNNKSQLACSIKYGLKGKLTITGRQFEGAMPANDLSPMDLAKVITYITNSFGNKAGLANITQVQADLANCK
ncbi:cbb3-type cytochrome c oxidase subunit III [Mucilaginibacter frigoritolerans]|uniref:Cbb3-type cytochrome c oxidase subunit III n=1 Tax=Mucilaginibacter frigoritolerans TaxID=652788 RepID=A0A562TX71_9SPHI|nr:cytochrome c [Mucilaginibacter frigoritolerans]TWI98229.1 cbb3-type cytochrome c oxidase subunit III [Mucilaginibacter frigoritolerans]